MGILCIALFVYEILVLVRVLSSWFRPPLSGPFRTILDFTYTVTEPLLRPLRRILPAPRFGSVGLDLSATVLLIAIFVVQSSIC